MTQKTLPDNVITLVYDSAKHLKQAKDDRAQIDFAYDAAGRMTATRSQGIGGSANLPAVELSFELDGNGNRTRLIDPVAPAPKFVQALG